MKSAAMNNTTLDRLLVIVLFAIMFLFEGQTKTFRQKELGHDISFRHPKLSVRAS